MLNSKLPYHYYRVNIKKFYVKGGKYQYFRIQKRFDGILKDFTATTKKEAEEKYFNFLENYINSNFNISNTKVKTVEEFVSYYLNEVVKASNSVKPNTISAYENIFKNKIKGSFIAKIKLDKLNTENCQTFINKLSSSGISHRYLTSIKIFLSSVLNYAMKTDVINKNPFTNIKMPKNEKVKENIKFLTDEEIKLLISSCKDEMLKVIIQIALSTSMRINEILALTENDFNLEKCCINVDKALTVGKDTIKPLPPKTKSSIRTVYFNKALVKDFQSFIANQKQKYFKIGKKYSSNSPIFINTTFEYINYKILTPKINTIFKDNNMPYSGFHVLRHTCASRLFKKGITPKVINEQLGHSSINMTLEIYTHLDEQQRQNSIETQSELFKHLGKIKFTCCFYLYIQHFLRFHVIF